MLCAASVFALELCVELGGGRTPRMETPGPVRRFSTLRGVLALATASGLGLVGANVGAETTWHGVWLVVRVDGVQVSRAMSVNGLETWHS